MRHSLALVLVLMATPASAWDVRSVPDALSNQPVTTASVSAGAVTLIVACTNGQPQPRITLDRRVGPGPVPVSYSFDQGPVAHRMATVGPEGYDLWPWPSDYSAAVWKLRRVKRFRLSIPDASFDFDLSTGDQLPALLC